MAYSLEYKKKLRDSLEQLVAQSGLSQNQYARERLGFSSASKISHIFNKWDQKDYVGEATWRIIENHLYERRGYKGIATRNLLRIWDVCERAQVLKAAMCITGRGGYGKTYALNRYKEKAEAEKRCRVFYFDASTVKTRKQFVTGLMHVLQCWRPGTMSQQVPLIREHLLKLNALLIIDEVSALEGSHVVILKDIMTALKDVCGIVMAGTPYFTDNINKGASKDRHLFSETKDRMFMIPENLEPPTDKEAEAIFKANGLAGEALDIVMGRVKGMERYAWRVKPTFRGIADCITMIRMADSGRHNKVEQLSIL